MKAEDSNMFNVDLNNYQGPLDILLDLAKTQKVDRLKCFVYQKKAIKNYDLHTNNLILKSRQTGFSVITAGYIAWRLLFKSDEKILIIANDFNGAKRLLKTVKEYVDVKVIGDAPADCSKDKFWHAHYMALFDKIK